MTEFVIHVQQGLAAQAGAPRQMKLKQKYLRGHRGRYSGGEKPAPRKVRRKLSDIQKQKLPAQPLVVLHILANGKGRFERR